MKTFFLYSLTCLTVATVSGTFECFCNFLHPEYYVLPCPDLHHRPIGTIDMPDHVLNHFYAYDLNDRYCKARLSGVQAPPGFEPILHYGQLAYLRVDAGFRVNRCTGTVIFNRGHLNMSSSCQHNIMGPIGLVNQGPTTPLATSPKPVQTTAAPVQHHPGQWHTFAPPVVTTQKPSAHWIPLVGVTPSGCRKNDVDVAVQGGKSIYHSDARSCGNSAASFDESVPLAFCNIKEVSHWTMYLQVRSNCAQLASYHPVSVFVNGNLQAGSGSGIFLGCTSSGGFKLARQTCASGKMEVVEINPGGTGVFDNVDNYYVIQ
ncbi:uncharacterized protein LOC132552971 [Ylistrum balloti]|uniref:uncharacterized protein LOC132552971 n=1 Tax=Ylistrum balloti TaxID=509963 RepID=UPI0029058DBD|nr:uncharacterized protein LOC132552971 [Ylistrum balloti]